MLFTPQTLVAFDRPSLSSLSIRTYKSYRGTEEIMSGEETATLIPPCGGELVDLTTPAEELESLKAYANSLPSIQLSERAVCDLELLATGGFSPLDRFMGR